MISHNTPVVVYFFLILLMASFKPLFMPAEKNYRQKLSFVYRSSRQICVVKESINSERKVNFPVTMNCDFDHFLKVTEYFFLYVYRFFFLSF